MIKVYHSITSIMDLSFPGQRTATSCILHDSVYMPGPCAGKSEDVFLHCDTWLQIFQNDSKICEAEVTLTPLINNICKAWNYYILSHKYVGLNRKIYLSFLLFSSLLAASASFSNNKEAGSASAPTSSASTFNKNNNDKKDNRTVLSMIMSLMAKG